MPDTAVSDDKTGVRPLLQSTFLGAFEVVISKLKLTTMGRPLREAGVKKMLSSIEEGGWIRSSTPVVILRNASDEKIIDKDNARDMTFRVLDGNHRVAALAMREKKRGGKEEPIITVSVHRSLPDNVQRIIADRE